MAWEEQVAFLGASGVGKEVEITKSRGLPGFA